MRGSMKRSLLIEHGLKALQMDAAKGFEAADLVNADVILNMTEAEQAEIVPEDPQVIEERKQKAE